MKTFTDGTLLTAEDINKYLVNDTTVLNDSLQSTQSQLNQFQQRLNKAKEDFLFSSSSAQDFTSGRNIVDCTGKWFPASQVWTGSPDLSNAFGIEPTELYKVQTQFKSLSFILVTYAKRGVLYRGDLFEPYLANDPDFKKLKFKRINSNDVPPSTFGNEDPNNWLRGKRNSDGRISLYLGRVAHDYLGIGAENPHFYLAGDLA